MRRMRAPARLDLIDSSSRLETILEYGVLEKKHVVEVTLVTAAAWILQDDDGRRTMKAGGHYSIDDKRLPSIWERCGGRDWHAFRAAIVICPK